MSLIVSNLSVSYGSRPAVRDLSLTVEPGEVVAVVGESGSGKSTTAHAITGLLPPGGHIDSGSIRFGSLEVSSLPERRLRDVRGRVIGLVPQDPTVSLNPVQRIGPQVAEVLRIHRLADRRAAALRAVELLERVGVPNPAARARQYPHELSGGLRQRVLIAIAIAAAPQLIVADEPTSALDVTVQKRILDLLDSLRAESGTSMLLITHDLALAAERAHRVVVMTGGRVVESGPTQEVLTEPRHEYTRKLLSAVTVERPARVPGPAPVLAEARNLTKRFGSLTAVDDVSFEIQRGRTHALVGESGSGKSTTARLLLRLVEPDDGAVFFDGTELTGTRRLREFRRRMQVVYQNPYTSLDPRYTVEKIVAEPLRVFGIGTRAERRAATVELLDRVALSSSLISRKPAELSGGQRQRVAIARALALKPDLVVLDEPVSALDASVSAQVLDLLTELQDDLGVAYLFISHDLGVVRRIAHTVGVMKDGRLVEQGSVATVMTEPEHEYTRELLAAVPRHQEVRT